MSDWTRPEEPKAEEPEAEEPTAQDEVESSIPVRFPDPPTPEPTSWMHPDPVESVSVTEPEIHAEEQPSFAANADYTPSSGLDVVEPEVEVERPEEEVDVPASEDVDEVIAEADEDDDEIVFDLAALSTEQRRHLSMRLTGAGITFLWEVATDLVVSVGDAPAVERYIEEARNPDGFGDEEMASFEEDSDVDDEEVYSAMSNLYVAADKLSQRPDDDATAGEFYVAVDDVDGLPAPFGFDPRVWSQVQELANRIADTLDAEGEASAIGADAKMLRQLLVNYV